MGSPSAPLTTIPARSGVAVRVARGQAIRVVNTHGTQVVDTWAFCADDLGEWMSMEHTRAHALTLCPSTGTTLYTNRRRPILHFLDDTSGGVHDTLIAACDRHRYALLGCSPDHANCTDNLAVALRALGLAAPCTPAPLNLFMHVPLGADGALAFAAPVSPPGGYVTLRAERDLVIAFSACPQDRIPVNGIDCTPVDAHFALLPGTP